MTAESTTPPSQPVPPSEQTTAATPEMRAGHDVEAVRSELVQEPPEEWSPPRPRSLATQEIRLALAFTGGVSLAIWMGGVARELNLLVQASERRRIIGKRESPETADENAIRRYYRRLLDLVDAEVAIDVIAGTSAGGINGAVLALGNARRIDLGPLRDIWLEAGDFGKLMRNPSEQSPPSLLKGDDQMLTTLNSGIDRLLAQTPWSGHRHETDVYITTTLLSAETSRFTDDYGTEIADSDHHGMFHFSTDDLTSAGITAPLSLAARSSASFPGAFEPSFLPFRPDSISDDRHPDMSAFSNGSRAHWAADGGLLVNRPIAPLVQRIFGRPADREVRRALLYVVPSSGSFKASTEDRLAKPLGLAEALQKDLNATLNQSISADLAAIKEHNDRVRAMADTDRRMAALGCRLPAGQWLSDDAAWRDYVLRQGEWLVTPLVDELTRQIGAITRDVQLPKEWRAAPGVARDAALRSILRDIITSEWPRGVPHATGVTNAAVALGTPAFESAKATLLRMVRLGRVLAATLEERNVLAEQGMRVSRPLSGDAGSSIRQLVSQKLTDALASEPVNTSVKDLARDLALAYREEMAPKDELQKCWMDLQRTYATTRDCLRRAVPPGPIQEPTDVMTTDQMTLTNRRTLAAAVLTDFLDFFDRHEKNVVAGFLDLHVAARSVLPVLTEVAQPVELIQVSADTRTLLSPAQRTAETKLTGMQLHHFGAFYKASWRANDWMWGRLDGCGWLTHMLLDPRRIRAVLENDGIPSGERSAEFLRRLQDALDNDKSPDEAITRELSFLDDESEAVPASLPRLALAVAEVLQKRIAAEELPVVAGAMAPNPTEVRPAQAAWLQTLTGADFSSASQVQDLLSGCPVPRETIAEEARQRTPLFVRIATQAAAVATAAGTGVGTPPTSLKPTFTTARTVTRTAYTVANQTGGKRRNMTLVGLAFLVGGTLAMLADIPLLGMTGLAAFAVGAVVIGFGVGTKLIDGLRIALALALVLVASAPLFPWLWENILLWLRGTGIRFLRDYPWTWPVLVLLVLLPALSAIGDFMRHRKSARA
jgi:patatin-related protein